MLSTAYRLKLHQICNKIKRNEANLEEVVWVDKLVRVNKSAASILKEAQSKIEKDIKIIDYFTYYNAKEILELRIKLLYDQVDEFIIVDANYTHSGQPKPYLCNQHIKELGLPRHKIKVIEVDLSPEVIGEPSYFDLCMNPEVQVGSRERIQRDYINSVINQFDDNCVFIVSDSDEIIKPNNINFLCKMAFDTKEFLKIPLVYLQGRADYRVYYTNTDEPYPWTGTYICTKDHLMKASATHMKASFELPFEIRYPGENGVAYKDLGWHFSWMGKNSDRLDKARMICHYDQHIEDLIYKNYYSNKMVDFIEKYEVTEGNTAPSGHSDMILKKYPLEDLPQLLFELPRVKNYLLPE